MMRPLGWSLVALFTFFVAAPSVRADSVSRSARRLMESGTYKVRLSAALKLGRYQDDRRAIRALAHALRRDGETTIRRVAAVSLSKVLSTRTPKPELDLALTTLRHAAEKDRRRRVRRSAKRALAKVGHLAAALAAPPRGKNGLYLAVGKPNDRTRRMPAGATGNVRSMLKAILEKGRGFRVNAGGSQPTEAQLRSRGLRGYFVGTSVANVSVMRKGSKAEVSCSVSVRVSPWAGRDGGERFVAGEAASAKGSGRVTSYGSKRAIANATRQCVNEVVREVATRQVMPFLQASAQR